MKISVILPAFNEQAIISQNARKIQDFLQQNFEDYELIIVDDGSTDNTKQEISDFKGNIKLVTYSKNRGKGAAVAEGVKIATGDLILFTDADLAYAPEHLQDAVRCMEMFEVAIGSRYVMPKQFSLDKDRSKYGLKRGLLSKLFIGYTNFIFGTKFSDIQAGIKGFHRDVARDIFSDLSTKGFGFDVEILAKARAKGYKIGEFAVSVSSTRSSSKVRLIKDSVKMFFNVLSIKLRN